MARAMSEDGILYRAVIKKTQTSEHGKVEVYFDYYGPYNSPRPGKQQTTRLRKMYQDHWLFNKENNERYKVDVDLERIERVGSWEVVND